MGLQVGIMKAEALRYSKGADAVSLMAGIKKLIDPKVGYGY